MATTLVAVATVLFLIFISMWFARLLGQVAAGDLQLSVVFLLLALKSVEALMLLLPLALFLSVLLAFGRLYKDSEMVAMLACGVSLLRVTRLVFWFGLGFAFIIGAITLYFGPLANAERYKIQEQLKASIGLESIAAGQFRELAGGEVIFYAERLSDNGDAMENVFIQGVHQGAENLLVAERAWLREGERGDRYLVLENGNRYEGVPGRADFRIIHYREHEIRVAAPEALIEQDNDEKAALPTLSLWASDTLVHKAELQWRMAMPLSAVLLALLAVFLSRTNPRQGRYGKFFLGILVYIIYSNLLAVARTWVERGKVDPLIGIWWVHALLVVVLAVMMFQHAGGYKALFGNKRIAPRMSQP
jgi:lipopolysaccharide export system permease protein